MSFVPEMNSVGTSIAGRCSTRNASGLPGRVQRIADQHEPLQVAGPGQAVGAGGDHRAHPPTHRAAAHHERLVDRERRQLVADRGEQHRRAVGRLAALLAVREVGAHARVRCEPPLGGHQRRVRRVGPGAGVQQHGHQPSFPVRMRRASLRSRIDLLAVERSPPWSGCTSRMRDRYRLVTSRADGCSAPMAKPSTSSAHAFGSASADSSVARDPARWATSAGPIGPRQRSAFVQHRADRAPARRVEPLDRVDRAEHLGEIAARGAEVELHLVALADQLVAAVREPVPVDLEAVAQARLHDAVALLDLADEPGDVAEQVVVDTADVVGDHGTEQEPAEAGRRIDRQHQVAERDPPGRHRRPGVEDLQLGQQHGHDAIPATTRVSERARRQTYGRQTVRSSSAAAAIDLGLGTLVDQLGERLRVAHDDGPGADGQTERRRIGRRAAARGRAACGATTPSVVSRTRRSACT